MSVKSVYKNNTILTGEQRKVNQKFIHLKQKNENWVDVSIMPKIPDVFGLVK